MATKKLEIYKCNVCGIIAEILDGGAGELVCCGEPMTLLAEKTEDVAKEKHVPVIEETEAGVTVKVGSVPHPMEEKHFIQWVEVISGGKVFRQFLQPGQPPEATFNIKASQIDAVREHCNIHGLWKA
jgi:superoxide reductase